MWKTISSYALGAIIGVAATSALAAGAPTASLAEGPLVLAPFSFARFCIDYPGECPGAGGPARVHLTSERMAELQAVNGSVNTSITPTRDTSALRFWKLNVDSGDCNAFAVQKRHELMEHGWPAAALALTVVKTSWGEGHLVVTVRTDRGDYVLDNLRSTILPWQRANYRWIMRQSEGDPQYWADLRGGRATPSAAPDSQDETVVAETADEETVPTTNAAKTAPRKVQRFHPHLPARAAVASAWTPTPSVSSTSVKALPPLFDANPITRGLHAASKSLDLWAQTQRADFDAFVATVRLAATPFATQETAVALAVQPPSPAAEGVSINETTPGAAFANPASSPAAFNFAWQAFAHLAATPLVMPPFDGGRAEIAWATAGLSFAALSLL